MGGNVTALTKTGRETRAMKVQLNDVGRQNFIKKVQGTLKALNAGFNKMHGYKIWDDESQISDAYVFNGSTSFVMSNYYTDAEILQYKPSVGDVDVTVPQECKEDLWKYLDSIEDKEIVKGVAYRGSNKPTVQSIGAQINSVFSIVFNDVEVNVQFDFEFLEFVNGRASEWSKFSHSSSYEDAVAGVKAVAHKYLLRAIVASASTRNDIVIATATSTPDKIKLTTAKQHQNPRMLKFSVDRGLRTAYEPMHDFDGNPIFIDGKQVFKEIPTAMSSYETNVKNIYKLIFSKKRADKSRLKDMNSFVGLLKLVKDNSDKKRLNAVHDKFTELLWGLKPSRAQELEVGNPELDMQIKTAAYAMLCKVFGLPDKSKQYCDAYYAGYGQRGKKPLSECGFTELLGRLLGEE